MRRLQFGRVLRRMGLPFWTFLGIGLSGVFVNYVGRLVEVPVRAVLSSSGIPDVWADGLSTLSILVLVVVTMVLIAAWQSRRVARPRPPLFGTEPLPKPEGKRGLILLVSRAESAMYAIRYHYVDKGSLEYVWLIPSNDIEAEHFGAGSATATKDIEAQCKSLVDTVEADTGERRDLRIVPWQQLVSPADAQDTFELVNRVYRIEARRHTLETDEIAADFTGGTKPMTVGMIMACLQADRSLEYVAYNPQTREMSGPFMIDYQHSAFDLIG